MSRALYTMVTGNPIDGIQLEGLWTDHAEAVEAGDTVTSEWWIVPIDVDERGEVADLRQAIRHIVDTWDSGDLAEAVSQAAGLLAD